MNCVFSGNAKEGLQKYNDSIHPAVVAEWSKVLSNVNASSILKSQVQILLEAFDYKFFIKLIK